MSRPENDAPESLESVLHSLQTLVEHSRHRPLHSLAAALPGGVREPFASEAAEQYDDPLVLDDDTPLNKPVIPVLSEVINTAPSSPAPRDAQIEAVLGALRVELEGVMADILADARAHLELGEPGEAVTEDGLKRYIAGLLERLPR